MTLRAIRRTTNNLESKNPLQVTINMDIKALAMKILNISTQSSPVKPLIILKPVINMPIIPEIEVAKAIPTTPYLKANKTSRIAFTESITTATKEGYLVFNLE
jgi:hypothetical protein